MDNLELVKGLMDNLRKFEGNQGAGAMTMIMAMSNEPYFPDENATFNMATQFLAIADVPLSELLENNEYATAVSNILEAWPLMVSLDPLQSALLLRRVYMGKGINTREEQLEWANGKVNALTLIRHVYTCTLGWLAIADHHDTQENFEEIVVKALNQDLSEDELNAMQSANDHANNIIWNMIG